MGASIVASGGDGKARAGPRQQEEGRTGDRPPSRQASRWGRQPRAQALGWATAVTQRDARRTQGPAGVEFRWGVRGPPGVLRAGVGGSEKRLEGWPGSDLRTRHPWRTDCIWAVLGAICQQTGPEWGGGRGREVRAGETSGRRAQRTEGWREAGGQGAGGGAGRPSAVCWTVKRLLGPAS